LHGDKEKYRSFIDDPQIKQSSSSDTPGSAAAPFVSDSASRGGGVEGPGGFDGDCVGLLRCCERLGSCFFGRSEVRRKLGHGGSGGERCLCLRGLFCSLPLLDGAIDRTVVS